MTHRRGFRATRTAAVLAGVLVAALVGTGATTATATTATTTAPAAGTALGTAAAAPAANEKSPRDKARAAVRGARAGMEIPDRTHPSLGRAKKDVGDYAGCDYSRSWDRLCARGDTKDPKRTVVVLGDSHGRFWIPAFEKLAWKNDWRAYYLVKEQCTSAYVLPAKLGSGEPDWKCANFRSWARKQIKQIQPDLVVAATSGPSAGVWVQGERIFNQKKVNNAYKWGWINLLRQTKPLADRVAVLQDVPASPRDPLQCLRARGHDLGDCLFSPLDRKVAQTKQSVIAARWQQVDRVNPMRWICFDRTCPLVIQNRYLTYRDQGHLTATFTRTLADVLARDLGMIG